MKNVFTFLLISLTLPATILAQEEQEEKTKIQWYGYISHESIFDSHDAISTRDGELILFPDAPNKDADGKDLNANSQLNMLTLQSRMGMKINGPKILGAASSGNIEGDFFGTAEAYKNMFRIRHVYMKFKWEKASLLMGQYWHPMFTPEVFPHVIAFGAAAIYNPLNRAPQIRFDYHVIPELRFTVAALEHGYHASVGPALAQRNAAMPDLQFQAYFGKKKGFSTGITAGVMALEPRETTLAGDINETQLKTINAEWFGQLSTDLFTIRAKALYGENMSQYVMLGGYGRLLEDTAATDAFSYTPYKIYSVWGEFSVNFAENFQAGIFAGFTGNLGAKEKIDMDNVYARGSKIMQLMRISPRISYTVSKFRFAIEYMYDAAEYGTEDPDEYGVYETTETSTNNRLIFAARYMF